MGGLPTLREAELALRCARVDEDGNITISDVVAQRSWPEAAVWIGFFVCVATVLCVFVWGVFK
jgi:hypothetical protein